MAVREAVDELQEQYERSTADFFAALQSLARAHLEGRNPNPARERLALLIGQAMTFADLLGRRRLILEVAAAPKVDPSEPVLFDDRPAIGTATGPVPFRLAIDDLISRTPMLATPQNGEPMWKAVARLYQEKHAFSLARAADLTVVRRVQETLKEAVKKGSSFDTVERALERMEGFSRAYAETVYRTNLATANTAGRFEQARHPAVAFAIGGFEFVAVLDGRERENHAAANGLIASQFDPIWDRYSPPLGYNCFLPGERVSGAFLGGLKARYDGPAVEVETRAGGRVRVTVNHPVLTSRGWVPAGSIREGDHCVSDLRAVEFLDDRELGSPALVASPGRAVDDQDVPARVEDVFDALGSSRDLSGSILSGVSALDLHGDADRVDESDVHVVGTYRELLDDLERSSELFGELPLVPSERAPLPRNRAGSLSPLGGCDLATSGRVPRSGALALDEPPVLLHARPLHQLRIGPTAKLNAMLGEEPTERPAVEPDLAGDLLQRCAGQVALDVVTKVRHFTFSGHVFDLQTTAGWLSSGGIVASNCRCALRLVTRAELKRKDLIDSSGAVRRREPGRFSRAHPDEGFERRGPPRSEIYGSASQEAPRESAPAVPEQPKPEIVEGNFGKYRSRWKDWRESLTEEEESALRAYVGFNYREIRYAQGFRHPTDPNFGKPKTASEVAVRAGQAAAVERALSRAPRRKATVHRFLDLDEEGLRQFSKQVLTQKEFTVDAVTSFSLGRAHRIQDRLTAYDPGPGMYSVIITAEKTTQAVWEGTTTKALGLGGNYSEAEWIVQKGSKFRVLRSEIDKKRQRIRVWVKDA